MISTFWLELLGYVASVLVAVSLMMSSILRLRIMNLVGSLTFGVYGVLIGAVPVAAVNFFIAAVNVFYLLRFSRTKSFFTLLEVSRASVYLDHFLGFYEAEIGRYVPGFRRAGWAGAAGERGAEAAALVSADAGGGAAEEGASLTLFVLRDVVPAGVLIGQQRGATLSIVLDFVIPGYRDFQIGRYLFAERADFFRARGIERVESEAGTRAHADYLRRMGFTEQPGSGVYALTVG
jgi:hypothetical protein